jgi:TPR repeat protein
VTMVWKTSLFAFLLSSIASAAVAAGLQAAVIGNTSYPAAPLDNAARDAAVIAEGLAENGFNVKTFLDVPAAGFAAMLEEISQQFAGADVAVLYYAGHAFQYEGQNHLLAVDIEELTRDEISRKLIPLQDLLDATKTSSDTDGVRLIIMDACRNDPFSGVDGKIQRGLAFEESGKQQTLISYSTSAGELAYDGPNGGNGPYALAFSRALQSDKPTLSKLLRSIRRDVRVSTNGLQIPWVVGSIENDPVIGNTAVTQDQTTPTPSASSNLDEIVWGFVRKDLFPKTLQEFINIFPASPFASSAQRRLSTIEEGTRSTTRQVQLDGGNISAQTLSAIAEVDEVAAVETAFEPETTIPAQLFSIWPEDLPQTERGLYSIVTECDLLASDPADPQRTAPPVRNGLVNIRAAARACGYALARDPENPRLLFQFGRVLQLAERHDWARDYYIRASAYDYSAALTNLGFMAIRGIGQDKDLAAAAEYYRQASELGNLRARTNIGTMYIKGEGLPKLPEEGILWYRLASSMGWANAQNALADLYRKGVGVRKDERAAAALYHLSAENGQRAAMNSLGRSYLSGWGVEPDRNVSHLWFTRAIEAGDRFAPRFLAKDLEKLGEAKRDPARVIALYELSADRGFSRAYLDLAKLFLNKKIGATDREKALLNARIAEIKELEGAAELVAKAKKGLSAEQISSVEDEIDRRRRFNGL